MCQDQKESWRKTCTDLVRTKKEGLAILTGGAFASINRAIARRAEELRQAKGMLGKLKSTRRNLLKLSSFQKRAFV